MPRFDLILPEGRLILRNPETGEMLSLSAENGPVTLGSVELAFGPAAGSGASAAQAFGGALREAPTAETAPASSAESGASPDAAPLPASSDSDMPLALDPLEFERRLAEREGFVPAGPEAVDPAALERSAPDAAESAGTAPKKEEDELPKGRVFEAPFDALTAEDFERTLEAISHDRDNLSRELEFLDEIEGDPQDIADLRKADQALERAYALAVKRFDAWKANEKRRDEA